MPIPPPGYLDAVTTRTVIHLSWKDRLKVLFGRQIECTVVMYCENLPGKVYSETKVFVHHDRPLDNLRTLMFGARGSVMKPE